MTQFADDDRDDSRDEDPLEWDHDPDDELDDESTVPCPFCKKPLHEDADICPRCGNFVGAANAPRRVPLIVWIGAALALLSALAWFLR